MNLLAFVPKSLSEFCSLSSSMASSTSDDEVEMMEVVPDGPVSRVDVCELFSRPRLVLRCGAFGLLGGNSFDFKDDSEMDLGTVNGRAAVWHHLETVQPEVAVLSPPCTLFSALMRLWCRESMGEAKYQSRRLVAERLLLFAVEIALFQIRVGRFFCWSIPTLQIHGTCRPSLTFVEDKVCGSTGSINAGLAYVRLELVNRFGKELELFTTSPA